MYFTFSNSEDGLEVRGPYTHDEIMMHIKDLTSEDIRPESRAVFTDKIPDNCTPTNHVYIIKGENVVPEAKQRVTEWSL